MAKISSKYVCGIGSSKFGSGSRGTAIKDKAATAAYGGKSASSINDALKKGGMREEDRKRCLSALEPKKKLKT
ncbi:MAG: hypothetical protein V1651_04025 [Patescibacteria group bacterium]